MKTRQSLSEFFHLNERHLFWLFVASCLVFVANWFSATHGIFEFENDRLRQLLMAVSMCSPVIGILVLLSQDCRNNTPMVAILLFLSMLLAWPVATMTCFVLLLTCWIGKTRIAGVCILVVLQVMAGILIYAERKNSSAKIEIARLSTTNHELVLRGESQDGNFCDSCAVQEDFPVINGVRLVKTFFRLKGKNFDYRGEIFGLSQLDANHAAIVIQHGPRSHCITVDLTKKNRLTEYVESYY